MNSQTELERPLKEGRIIIVVSSCQVVFAAALCGVVLALPFARSIHRCTYFHQAKSTLDSRQPHAQPLGTICASPEAVLDPVTRLSKFQHRACRYRGQGML